ncbi:uncharacterized protein (TIGR04141 family) [Chryseomicrobium aureum]|uniref:DUF6119 family protein n=1 Tax=Chryseomicrobium aureum TaxID=1441723 RepID=UPI00195D9159|nr:DUF6119 family protein [Chryseomicrobium aureum]MBM7706847.1 uncharacterized protein (TIGR04141 family) [Chryseomicrobium aureum]
MTKYKVTAYLIKQDYENLNDVIKEDAVVKEYELKDYPNLEGKLIVGLNKMNSPTWINLVKLGIQESMEEILNSSTRALLLLNCEDNTLAFVFGFGRHLLKDEYIVKDFGIKVVLNSVDSQKLKSIDKANVGEMTIQSRTQTSSSSSVNVFGIDIAKDFLKAVTGEPVNEKLGKVITGRESAQFEYDFENDFNKFQEVCNILIEKYKSDEYKEDFSWVDNLQQVNDSKTKEDLNSLLMQTLKSEEVERISLAPPEIIEWNDIGKFSYTEGGERSSELEIGGYLKYIEKYEDLTFEQLNRHYIHVWSSDDENARVHKWKVYDCMLFETTIGSSDYVLTMGSWFKLDQDFVSNVEEYLSKIDYCDLDLPICKKKEKEGEYNLRVADGSEDIVSLDAKLVRYQGSNIEVCDLLTNQGHLIHVKPWTSSSTLSHLFSQGRVSSESLLEDIEFRKLARDKIAEIDERFMDHILEEGYNPNDIEIVYAIIDSSDKVLTERLPFFSKLNMMQAVKHIKTIGYKVTLLKVKKEK